MPEQYDFDVSQATARWFLGVVPAHCGAASDEVDNVGGRDAVHNYSPCSLRATHNFSYVAVGNDHLQIRTADMSISILWATKVLV